MGKIFTLFVFIYFQELCEKSEVDFALMAKEVQRLGFKGSGKTTVLKQDPPNHRLDGGLCLHPLSSTIDIAGLQQIKTCQRKTALLKW